MAQKPPKSRYHLFLRDQLDMMTGEDQKNYQSIVSRRWKGIKEDPARLFEYNYRARQMQNEAQDSQNEKMMVDRPTAKHLQKVPKIPEFVDTDLDDTDDEQGPAVKKPQKAPKTHEFVYTDSDDSDNEQEPAVKRPQKAPKIYEYSDDEQEPAVKCIVMYSTDDEQEPVIKQPQKASKIPKFVDTGTED